jgi:hypothetical protein
MSRVLYPPPPMDRRLDEPQNQSGKDKVLNSYPSVIQSIASCYTDHTTKTTQYHQHLVQYAGFNWSEMVFLHCSQRERVVAAHIMYAYCLK